MVAVINPIQNLQTVYISMYGRPADPQGLAYWNKITSNGTNLAPMVEFFAVSPEFVSLFGPAFAPNAPVAPSTNDIQVAINQVYQQAFGRDADPAGLTYWTEQIQSGKVNATQFAMIIVQEAQPADAAVVAAKLGTADSFTASINTTQEMLQYPTDAGLDAGRAFLAPVVSVATQPSQAQIDAQLALIAAGDVAAGQTFTLTTGVDTFTGTAGNDTFQAELEFGTSTITTFDNINGAGGLNTLNIVGNGGDVNANATFANIQVVNVDVTGPITNLNSASFGGVQQLWQIGNVNDVTIGAGVVAGFRNVQSPQFFDPINVTVNAAQSASVAFDNVGEGQELFINGSAGTTLNSVNISGTVVDGDADGEVGFTFVDVHVGNGVQTLSVNSAVDAVLTVSGTLAKPVTAVDASASAGAISLNGSSDLATIRTGTGDDTLFVNTITVQDNVATSAVEAISGLAETGAGNDFIEVATTGTGSTTVNSGAGNDEVLLDSDGSGKLAVNLGAGNDTFARKPLSVLGEVVASDTIDGGEGIDTLQLNLVTTGVVLNNVEAFSNFELFDVAGLASAFDAQELAAKNIVTEFVASNSVVGPNAAITGLAAGIGYRVIGDAGNTALALTQTVAGALSVALDVDETVAPVSAANASAAVNATNATSVNAVFSSDFAAVALPAPAIDNVATLTLETSNAAAVTVNSGGTNASNVLNLNDAASVPVAGLQQVTGKVATITVTGAEALELDFQAINGSVLTSINASAQTGGLTTSLAFLKDGGNITLGSGTDTIIATDTSNVLGVESVTGLEKAAAVAVSTLPNTDPVVKQAAIDAADTLVLAGGTVANVGTAQINGVTVGAIDANGVLTFTAFVPGTLTAAVDIANIAANLTGEVTVFEWQGSSYMFEQAGNGVGQIDTLVELVGIVGVTHVAEAAPDHFFIV